MPVENYGVLKGKILDSKVGRDRDTPHYQILVEGEENIKYRVAINVMTNSEVLYLADDKYDSEAIKILPTLSNGFNKITQSNKELSLDYIRGNMINDRKKMIPLPQNRKGPNNDLNDFIDAYIKKCKNNNAIIYVYGSKFESPNEEDGVFGFKPEQGMHDVHMNQGNHGWWKKDNGIWQDGGILIHHQSKWTAIFLAFLSQTWCTDEEGNQIKQCSYNE
ncbi:MAG: DUF2278 family protein [Lachnotalea sp.]